jgi:REP element-mobilizing transposase RayT
VTTTSDDGPSTPDVSYPVAYFITWTCYGTWLHGDERGSVDRLQRAYGSPSVKPSRNRLLAARERLKGNPFALTAFARRSVDTAIRETAVRRGWTVVALNVRTNHVHAVVSGQTRPEAILQAFKAWSTRRLAQAGLVPDGQKVWTRHGSTRYLWTERGVQMACAYVSEGQGPSLIPNHPANSDD